MANPTALAARTCARWRSACSSSTPATEVCDDRCCYDRSAGGVALPQPGQHVSDLPAKWYFRYLVGLSDPATGALALGKAFHGTLARNFRQKMSTGRDMENGALSEIFDAEWSAALSEAELRGDEDPAELASMGRAIVEVYVAQAAPSVKPRAVE